MQAVTKTPAPAELERVALALATGAARVVARGRDADLQVSAKSSATDLVTSVDRATERWLREQIAQQRPGDGVLGEEAGEQHGSTGVRWVIDPIDGTVNFVLGLPQYAVSVAAEHDGAILAGAVCNPATGTTFHAHLGGGAFMDGRTLAGPRDVPLHRAVVGTGFSYDAAWRTRQAEIVTEVLPRVADLRRLGAASLDLCFTAAGWLDAYFEVGLNPWDHAAGGLIAREAGCLTSGLRGRPAGRQMYAVTSPGLADDFFGLLERAGADTVSR
jgi:myo-inositol-1(or 4)-monophosphatase